jgi:iron(III) transport system permease protein
MRIPDAADGLALRQGRRLTLLRNVARVAVPAALLAVIAILVFVPLSLIVFTSFADSVPFTSGQPASFTLANYAAIWDVANLRAVRNTLILAVLGTTLAMALGCSLAWLAARTDVPMKPLIHLASIMPIFVSQIVSAIAWLLLASGRTGYLNMIMRELGIPVQLEIESFGGIIFLFGIYLAPFPYIFLYSALTLINSDMDEAALVHGATTPQILTRITFPLVKPALLGSALLIFVFIIEDFPMPQILGYAAGIETLSVRIYRLMAFAPTNPNQASAFAVVLTFFVCFLVFAQRYVLEGRDYRTVSGKGAQARLFRLGGLRWWAIAFVLLYVIVAVGLPLFALTQGALRPNIFIRDLASLFDVSQLTTRHFANALSDRSVRIGFVNSLIAGGSVAVFGVAFYFLLAYVARRTDLPGRRLLEYAAMAPLAVPALVLAMGILWFWVSVPLPIYGTIMVIIIAFVARFMPAGYRVIAASVQQVHDDLESAALLAGATRLQTIRRITLPLLRGGVAAAAFLMIVFGLRELTASLFLYTPSSRVLSIVIFEKLDDSWSSVATICLLYMTLLGVLALAGRKYMRAAL